MRLEVVRIIADWLLHPTYGVNAYLPTVPKDEADPAPDPIAGWTDPTQAQVTESAVYDETRHDWAANRLVDPPATPCLSVIVQDRMLVEGEPTPDGQIRRTTAPVQVAIRYYSNFAEVARGVRNGDYTMRAVMRSLRELSKNANEASRTRNGILLELFEDPMEVYPIVEAVGSTYVAGALVVNCRVRDYNPTF